MLITQPAYEDITFGLAMYIFSVRRWPFGEIVFQPLGYLFGIEVESYKIHGIVHIEDIILNGHVDASGRTTSGAVFPEKS